MGGRGSSSSGGAGSGSLPRLTEKAVTLPDGSKVEFDGTLNYGADDPTLSSRQRSAVESWESQRFGRKVEYAAAFHDGTQIAPEKRGGKGSARVSTSWFANKDNVFSHTHPSGNGFLGGTFSDKDLQAFAGNPAQTMRAAAAEGTYSISKTGKFDRTGFLSYFKTVQSSAKPSYDAAISRIDQQYKKGSITFAEKARAYAKAGNEYLIALHNGISAGQKKYGYYYALEQR